MVVETFFYLLDVGTSNAMILYNEAMKFLQNELTREMKQERGI